MSFTAKMHLMAFVAFTLAIVVLGQKEYLMPHCRLPLHHGVTEKCTNTSEIRYHMDVETDTCLAFRYTGCGGNANNFKTSSECYRCFAMDYSGCPVASPRVPSKNNMTICNSPMSEKCDGKDAYCQNGAFFGQCCDSKIRDKLRADESTECGPTMKKYQRKSGSFETTLLGKSCASNFCPVDTKCQQGNYFAYCCA